MRLGAICDVLPEKKEAADSHGVPFYADYTEMCDLRRRGRRRDHCAPTTCTRI